MIPPDDGTAPAPHSTPAPEESRANPAPGAPQPSTLRLAPYAPAPYPAPGDHAAALGAVLDRVVPLARTALAAPDVENRRAELAALEAARIRRELGLRADDRGVPRHPELRAVALAERVERPTMALVAIERALAWRAATRQHGALPQPLVVVLAGPPGVGKSTAVARLVTRWSRRARFVRAREVAALASWETGPRALLGAVQLLAVDEAGLEEGDRAGARIAGLLCERTDCATCPGAVTVVVTNLDAAAFRARYVDDRLASRLDAQERRGCEWWVELGGDDLRQEGA